MAGTVTVSELLDDHVVLDLECLDRLYLNAYVPNLQVSGQVVTFMRDHLRCPVPSPAIMTKIGERFRAAVTAFAEPGGIPVLRFKGDDRQIDRSTDRQIDRSTWSGPIGSTPPDREWWRSGWPRTSSGSSPPASARAGARR